MQKMKRCKHTFQPKGMQKMKRCKFLAGIHRVYLHIFGETSLYKDLRFHKQYDIAQIDVNEKKYKVVPHVEPPNSHFHVQLFSHEFFHQHVCAFRG